MKTPSIWGPDEGMDTDYYFSLPEMPTGDPLLWDKEESDRALAVAVRFATEYVWDWNANAAGMRCGIEAGKVKETVNMLMNHWLVRRAIKAAQARFKKLEVATEDTALALVHRDASDFGPFANPMARTSAQRTLVEVLGMKEKKEKTPVGMVAGGVLVVPGLVSVDTWERAAIESQDALTR